MAAGQQKKRLISSGVTRLTSLDKHQQRSSKKKGRYHAAAVPDHVWSLRPHVALEWDSTLKSAVARKDQVGITWRDLSPFLDTPPAPLSPPQPHPGAGLADVVSVPEDIFGLGDLSDVLSYEVWEKCLTESERKFLTRFLPEAVDPEDMVRSLLQRDNFHFGNPLESWSASLCSGELHPDLILKHKKNLKDMKKNYYSGLRKYHNQLIDSVLTWKEKWTSCKNPEKEIVEKLWRKGAITANPTSSGASERLNSINTPRNKMTSESCFSFENDTKYMSYFKVSKRQHRLITEETHSGDGILSKTLNRVLGGIEGFNLQPYVKFEEEEKRNQHEHWLRLAYNDLPVAYECFREQGALRRQGRNKIIEELSEIKDAGNSTDDHVKDEETKEAMELSTTEQGNAGQYLSDEDLQQDNEKCHLERIPSLNTRHEFEVEVIDPGRNQDNTATTKVDSSLDHFHLDDETQDTMRLSNVDKNDSATCDLPENVHQRENNSNLIIERDHLERIPSLNTRHEAELLVVDPDMNQDGAASPVNSPLNPLSFVDVLNHAKSNPDQATTISDTSTLKRLPSLNSHKKLKTAALAEDESKDIDYSESRSSASPLFFGNIKDDGGDIDHAEGSGCSAREMWTEESVMNSYCGPASQRRHMYNSNDDLSHKQPQRIPQVISVEADTLVGHTSEAMPSLAAESGTPFFNQYSNQHQSMLLPTFNKEQGLVPAYSSEHLDSLKRSEFSFLGRNGCLPQSSSSSHHFQGREVMLEHNHTGNREHYLNLMAGNNRYPNLNQALTGGEQDWFSYCSTNGGLTGQEMFPTELRSHTGWSGVGSSGNMSHCLGNERTTDGSLYSVLPEYSKGVPSYPSNSSLGHLIHASNYLGNDIYNNGNVPGNNFSYRMIPGQVGNFNSREATATAAPLKAGGLPWMSYPHQNPSVNDLIGKSYVGSWNQ